MKPLDGPGGPNGPDPIDPSTFQIPDAEVSHIRRRYLDIAYASLSPSQKLDLYLPEDGDGPFPVILHIHGGAFAVGDKRDAHLTPFLRGLDRGCAVVSVNYRLSGEAIFPAGLQDIKAAIRWLRRHAGDYHLDGSRIAACGGSAGGNYAAMVAFTADVADFDDPALGDIDYPCGVRAAVDWFGPTDFLKMDCQLQESGLGVPDHSAMESPESRYLGAQITEVPGKARLANPMTYIHESAPPILIQHGAMDRLVPVQQSIEFARELHARLGPDRFEFDILDDAGHGDPFFEADENMDRVFAFLDRYLK